MFQRTQFLILMIVSICDIILTMKRVLSGIWGIGMKAAEVLKTYFGYDVFRKGQEDIIGGILSGRDALAIMPTGAGKSIC